MKKRLFLIGVAVIACIVTALFILDVSSWESLDLSKLNSLHQTTILYDAEGREIASLSGVQDRTSVTLHDIPGEVQLAFLAAEDARFYSHPGVDVWRIGGAVVHDIKSGGYNQGASTITQQLVKLTHLTNEKVMSRKIQEAFLALQLERKMSKEEILESYLNVIYFGNGAYGIEAAAQKYFGIPASSLSLDQGALLAAIIKSPSKYAPHLNADAALGRRNLILDAMANYEFITAEAAEKAKAEPIEIIVQKKVEIPYLWYVDAVTAEAETLVGVSGDEFLTGGYRVYTSLDVDMQKNAEQLFADDTKFPPNASDGEMAQAALVAMDVQNGEVVALVGGRSYETRRGLNRATQIKRQPGSALKPISVYASAVDRYHYLPSSFVDDTQRTFEGNYAPRNFGNNYHGEVTLREALARSLNVATVDLLSKTGIPSARQYATKAGITLDDQDNNLSIALGSLTYGVSPMELNAAYAPLANGGKSANPHFIREIRDTDDAIIYQFQPVSTQVMSTQSAYLITDMLTSAASWGSASALNSLGFDVAGKTGTVAMQDSGNRDAWTVAYTPSIAVTVWMGFDQPDKIHRLANSTGGSAEPARLASAFLNASKKRSGLGKFVRPSGLVEVLLDNKALKTLHHPMLASDLTPKSQLIRELFPANQAPTAVSNIWNAPSALQGFSLNADASGMPQLSFTAHDGNAVYLVYRETAYGEALLTELTGDVGQTLIYVDDSANIENEVSYYVVPVNAELYANGKILAGNPTQALRFQPKTNRLLDWFTGGGQEKSETPAPTTEPVVPNETRMPEAVAAPVEIEISEPSPTLVPEEEPAVEEIPLF